MFSFMLTDSENPIRFCKHCTKAFVASRPGAVFCSPPCKNKHNVYKSRAKNKREGDGMDMNEEYGLTPYETREILFYKTDNGEVRVEILLYRENLWLTQAKMADLFEVQKAAISKHLKNIFESGELQEEAVVSKMETTAADGKRYNTNYYNLDAIIAVGYRVNSKKATMFRIWANRVLKEFIIKGYVMDDARLREPENLFGKDYFEEQLERIRDIRSSARRFYQKITDIYSQCSADYDVNSPVTKEFFTTVQNKLHYAVTHHTAAEIVYGQADSTKPNMGLTTWKNAPQGRIRKSDVSIAKNYLNEEEMINLNEIVTMYLDYAERQARRGNIMYMQDWVRRLDAFLQFNEEDILHDKGKVTAAIAKAFAESEFEKFRVLQDRTYQSDFDRLVANIEETKKNKINQETPRFRFYCQKRGTFVSGLQTIYQFVQSDFFRTVLDVVHTSHPFHSVCFFECFGHAFQHLVVVEGLTVLFQITATHTLISADTVLSGIRQNKIKNEIISADRNHPLHITP